MMGFKFRVEVEKICSPGFEDSAIWALANGLLTERELTAVIADEILSNIVTVKD